MKHIQRIATYAALLLAVLATGPASILQAQQQQKPATPASGSFFDWVEDAIDTTAPVTPQTLNADNPILGLWLLQPALSRSTVVRQYQNHDGALAMVEGTIDEKSIPHFTVYSAKFGTPGPIYTDETFAKFLLNGTKPKDTVSLKLVDRYSVTTVTNTAAVTEIKSTLSTSTDAATLTEELDYPATAGRPARREKRVFTKQTATTFIPIQMPVTGLQGNPLPRLQDNPDDPLMGTWLLNPSKSRSKPESGSVNLQRFIDMGKGVFAVLSLKVSRMGAPTAEMAVVQYEGPGGLILALPTYTHSTIQTLIERGAQPPTAVAYKSVNRYTVESVYKTLNNGQISSVTTRRIGMDLMEITETKRPLNLQGKSMGEIVAVYDRIAP